MNTITQTMLILSKQNFKFSAAHFLIFDQTRAERLHGHNYQVRVQIMMPSKEAESLNQKGYFIDFHDLKKIIKASLDAWDEMVLLPGNHPEMKVTRKNESLEVRFRERFYVFPENEVLLLPITNTSVEQMAQLLAQSFLEAMGGYGINRVGVTVEETRGQGARVIAQKAI